MSSHTRAPRYCCGWYRHHRHVAIRGRTQIMWPAKATRYALRMPGSHMLCTVPYFCPCSSIADCHLNDIYDCPWVSPSITGKWGLFIYNWETASLSTLLSSFCTSGDRWDVEARVYQFIIHVQQEPGVANNSTVPLIVQYVSHNTKMFSKLSVLVFHTIYDLLLLAFLH